MKQINVLHLGKFYPIIGGVEKVMYDLCTGLSKRGIHADMLCASVDNQTQVISINSLFSILCTPSWAKAMATMISPSMILRLKSICNKYDIIHIHHPDPMACLSLFLSGYKGKVVLHWHSDIVKQSFALKFYNPLQNWLIRRADVIVGTSVVYLKESPFLTSVQNKCVALPIGIYEPMHNDQKAINIRKRYRGKRLLFSLGRLVEYKGFQYLIQALSLLPQDYCLVLGGAGPLDAKLKSIIVSNNLQERVLMPGRLSDEDVYAYFEAADVFVFPSIMKTEAFGIVQIEAMAFGTPIVACKIEGSGVPWVNKDGYSGINVEPQNPNALADAIQSLLNNEQTYSQYCVNARNRYEEMFTIDKMVDNCIAIYKPLINNDLLR